MSKEFGLCGDSRPWRGNSLLSLPLPRTSNGNSLLVVEQLSSSFALPPLPFSQHILWFLYSTSTIFSISFTSTSFILYSTQAGTLVLFQVLQSKLCCVVPPTHTAHLRLFSHRSGSLFRVQKTISVFSPKHTQLFVAGLTYIPFIYSLGYCIIASHIFPFSDVLVTYCFDCIDRWIVHNSIFKFS